MVKIEAYLLSSGTLCSDGIHTIFTPKVENPDSVCLVGINPVQSSVAEFFSELQQAALAGI